MGTSSTKSRNRDDHFLPQGYLRGFIDPARRTLPRPLWVYFLRTQRWEPKSPARVGYKRGFYDYSRDGKPDQTADQAFMAFENDFPRIRDAIIREGFSTWSKHRDFLLNFGQMLRARTPFFHQQHRSWTEKAVSNLSPREPKRAKELAKNWAITDMRTEICRGCAWFSKFDWAMRFTRDPNNPVITSDVPLMVEGSKEPDLQTAIDSGEDTIVYLPVCWQMCLVGHRRKGCEETAEFPSPALYHLRVLVANYADEFLASPTKQTIEDPDLKVYIGH